MKQKQQVKSGAALFNKILIANRGEIALRVIRACRDLGIRTVIVHSQADRDSLPVRLADEAICIGKAPSRDSYLNIPSIISAAEIADVDAVHPGYGFLSENAHFAEICQACNITFIGPPPEAIKAMGQKDNARTFAKKCGVPVVPGSDGEINDPAHIMRLAERIGYPVILKAVAGGGGKGMRLAHNSTSLYSALEMAKVEAQAAFGNSGVYLEKYIECAKHIEIQILADQHGNVVHLGERECSLQRRHQKLLEESPSPVLDPKIRRKMEKAAVRLAQAAKYVNAGTMEFLFDVKAKAFYFIEMNTRIQVEHPITELVTGIDLVKAQIRVAAGEKLWFKQGDINPCGHAIECRINAEDPEQEFRPYPGRIATYHIPGGPGVRLDSHAFQGYVVPPFYDSLIAKLIVHAKNRHQAIARLKGALAEYQIGGIKTTIPLHLKVLSHPQFIDGSYITSFLEKAFDFSGSNGRTVPNMGVEVSKTAHGGRVKSISEKGEISAAIVESLEPVVLRGLKLEGMIDVRMCNVSNGWTDGAVF